MEMQSVSLHSTRPSVFIALIGVIRFLSAVIALAGQPNARSVVRRIIQSVIRVAISNSKTHGCQYSTVSTPIERLSPGQQTR
eukprot:3167447-Amphidinium_carterae.1